MISKIYSIRDELSGFMSSLAEANDAVALRNFVAAVRNPSPGNVMRSAPSNFSLYALATFDTDSGFLEPITPIQHIANAISYVADEFAKEAP